MELSIKVLGLEPLVTALTRFEEGLSNLRGPLTGLAREVIAPILRRRFATGGPGWAPLSPAYATWKAQHFPGKGILVRTGAMETAFTGGVGMEIVVTANTLTIDPSRVPYWRLHQAGTARMPARPILSFDARDQAQMTGYLSHAAAALGVDAGLSLSEAAT